LVVGATARPTTIVAIVLAAPLLDLALAFASAILIGLELIDSFGRIPVDPYADLPLALLVTVALLSGNAAAVALDESSGGALPLEARRTIAELLEQAASR
jgi:hypothetical protein